MVGTVYLHSLLSYLALHKYREKKAPSFFITLNDKFLLATEGNLKPEDRLVLCSWEELKKKKNHFQTFYPDKLINPDLRIENLNDI